MKAKTVTATRHVFMLCLIAVILSGCQPAWHINHPYRSVDWQQHGQYKANLHTHTMVSDGWMNPQTIVETYMKLGYQILAISDHFAVTYPWEEFSKFEASKKTKKRIHDRLLKPEESEAIPPEDLVFKDVDAAATGMIDIQGNELRYRGHDINSFFNDYNGSFSDGTLDTVAVKGGILVFNHPGRYKLPTDWYVELYQQYDHLVGIEVFNCGNRYPNDRQLWDSLLTKMASIRPVWGFSNDDMHSLRDLGRNWNVFILPELSETWVRRGMEKGIFYFINAPHGHKGLPYPSITAIDVNAKKGMITIRATATDSILWIGDGKKMHKGIRLRLDTLPVNTGYIRAELYGAGNAVVCTQPFFIQR